MSQVMVLCDPDANVECDNCGWTGKGRNLELISDFEDRVTAEEEAPAGQCPECAGLAHLIPPPLRERFASWKKGEYGYCCDVVRSQGDDNVTRDPKTIAAYLRVQAADAFRYGDFEIAARLGEAATSINCDARNNHNPDWARAVKVLTGEPA